MNPAKPLFAHVVYLLIALLVSASAWALPPELAKKPTYGSEIELTHPMMSTASMKDANGDALGKDPVFGKAKLLFVNNLMKLCKQKGCTIKAVKGKWQNQMYENPSLGSDYLVTLSDGWWFKVSHDPGCVEIQTKPSTLEELKAQREVINEMIFESGTELGFRVPRDGSAHFNIGVLAAFGNDTKSFLRFFVDYQNRPELALGVLGLDLFNAPPLSVLNKEQRSALAKIVRDVNADKDNKMSVAEVAERITKEVYTHSYDANSSTHYYQAVGLKYVTKNNLEFKDMPMELRSIWNQQDADQFIKLAELIEVRIAFTKNQTEDIRYSETDKKEFSTTEMLTKFYFYVTEAGLEFEDYKVLLPDSLKNVKLDIFMNERASITDRLANLEEYRDVMAYSPGLRAYARELVQRTKQAPRKPFELPKEPTGLSLVPMETPLIPSCKRVYLP